MKTAMTQPKHRAMKPDGEPRMKVKLRHKSHVPGSEGNPGQIVDVPTKRGRQWIEEKAAEATEEPATPAENRSGSQENKEKLKKIHEPTGMRTDNTP